MASYISEIDAKRGLDIDTWRNLSKDKVLTFLQTMPQMDPEVAKRVVAQIPEIASLARQAIDDATKTHTASLEANGRSHEAAQQVALKGLAILREELGRDNLTPEDRMLVLGRVSDAIAAVLESHTKNQHFIAQLNGQTLATIGMAAVTVASVVIAAAMTGQKPSLSALLGKS